MRYKYNIIRSFRKSISISVTPENEITVRCPWSVSEEKIEQFVDSKNEWLSKIVAKNAVRLSSNIEILEYKQIYVQGKRLPLVITDRNEITDAAVYVKSVEHIKDTYIKKFSKQFIVLAEKISEEMQLTANSFSVKAYKGKWGCCDTKKNIVFNYLLFMLPAEIQRYVIIHELCHTVCLNHSPAFWQFVKRYEPNYKQIRNSLKDYEFLIDLYCK